MKNYDADMLYLMHDQQSWKSESILPYTTVLLGLDVQRSLSSQRLSFSSMGQEALRHAFPNIPSLIPDTLFTLHRPRWSCCLLADLCLTQLAVNTNAAPGTCVLVLNLAHQ